MPLKADDEVDLACEAEEVRPTSTTMVEIKWRDGHLSQYSWRYLRQRCRCAQCIEEWSGQPLLDGSKVPEGLKARDVKPIGLYAIQIFFDDDHDTGLFAFNYLRSICPCDSCVAAAAS